MSIRKAHYATPPRPLQSHAAITVEVPFIPLLKSFERHFFIALVKALASGNRRDEGSVREQAVFIERYVARLIEVEDSTPSRLKWDGRWKTFEKISAKFSDLLNSEGSWRRPPESTDSETEQLLAELQSAIRDTNRTSGPDVAQAFARNLWKRLREEQVRIERDLVQYRQNYLSKERLQKLRKLSQDITEIPKTLSLWKRLLLRSASSVGSRWVFNEATTQKLRRAAEEVQAMTRIRHDELQLEQQLSSLQQVLGNSDRPGRLQELIQSVGLQQAAMTKLADQIPAIPMLHQSTTNILIVGGLEALIGESTSQSLADYWVQTLDAAGFSVGSLASRIREDGLRIRGTDVYPDEFVDHEPREVYAAVWDTMMAYLGTADPERPLHFHQPEAPVDYLAAFVPAHPAFAHQLNKLIPEVIRRTKPYTQSHSLAGHRIQEFVFLHCHPSIRPMLLKRLEGLSTISEATEASKYTLGNPFRFIVETWALSIPVGALIGWQQWASAANRAATSGLGLGLFPRHDFPTFRLVPERDESQEYAELLFSAARKCHAIQTVGNAKAEFRLARIEHGLTHLFQTVTLEPTWQPETKLSALLRTSKSFVIFLEREFSSQTDIRDEANRLMHEQNIEIIVAWFRERKLIEVNRAGQWKLTKSPTQPPPAEFVKQLFVERNARTVGLDHECFVGAIQRDDNLHNALFWSVLDAWQLGELAENDIPEFIRNFAESLK